MSVLLNAVPVNAQANGVRSLRAELASAKKQIVRQQHELEDQDARLKALETRMAAADVSTPAKALAEASPPQTPTPGGGSVDHSAAEAVAPREHVGQAAPEKERPPEVAILGDQGSVITRRGQLTAEAEFDYSHADRNVALFRGTEIVQGVLVGAFDINQSRQDILTSTLGLRYGLTSALELGVHIPFVHRADSEALAPIQGSSDAQTISTSAQASGLGDVEITARYQLTRARAGLPYLIANLQLLSPTGTGPFSVRRDALGVATQAATGAGFWGVSPSLTAILPTDPAVIFGSIGYTHNFGSKTDTAIGSELITHVKPGDSINFNGGIGF